MRANKNPSFYGRGVGTVMGIIESNEYLYFYNEYLYFYNEYLYFYNVQGLFPN